MSYPKLKLAFCALIFSVLVFAGGGTGILYIVGETVDTIAEEGLQP